MRTLTTALACALALSTLAGCGSSGSALAPAADTGLVDGSASPADLAALATDSASLPPATFEVYDAETGALVLSETLQREADGSYEIGFRDAQTVAQSPLLNTVFRVGMTIQTEGPAGMVPRGYTAAGNPLYYIGDTVVYDSGVEARHPSQARLHSKMGSFDVEYTHLFAADNSLLPECIPGQNPLTIRNVSFLAKTPNVGPYSWSPDGKAFNATGMQYKLCDLPGLQYGTDLVNCKLYWVVPGSKFGLPCNTCEVRCVVYDRVIGFYDPPA